MARSQEHFTSSDVFVEGLGVRPLVLDRGRYFGSSQDLVTTGGQFTITTSNCTPVLASYLGRPAVKCTNSGITATDGINVTGVAACIIPQASKRIRIYCSYASDTQTDGAFAFGLAQVDTTIIASDPTDFVMLRKTAAATVPSLRARKASGTAETWSLAHTVTADAWHDFMMEIKRDASTAGKGTVSVWGKASATGGQILSLLGEFTIATQLPDTVALAPFFAVQAGSAANVTSYIGGIHWDVEA